VFSPAFCYYICMETDQFKVLRMSEDKQFESKAFQLLDQVWEKYLGKAEFVEQFFGQLYSAYPDLQFLLVDTETDEIAVIGNSFAFKWHGGSDDLPDEGLGWAASLACGNLEAGKRPNTQVAFQIVVNPGYKGRKMSYRAVEKMIGLGRQRGFERLLLPLRPSLKESYPLTPMENYVQWRTEDGLPYDPWLRVHLKLGGKLLGICRRSAVISGSVATWEEWTGLRFFESGDYILPQGLNPVKIDLNYDRGLYIEPNVWVVHEFSEESKT
jgi:hypothetical protein